eukprot:TRINITY_DN2927_c0_g1_i1.p1 TRINITY_DN2927_c0_g1~~TRINITY_DN2927_c0_g1_i1.p1  ORF type:complete len:277 (+),score=18.45 TRINITY_DN2927_c0_g1_i1:731-1561(+)
MPLDLFPCMSDEESESDDEDSWYDEWMVAPRPFTVRGHFSMDGVVEADRDVVRYVEPGSPASLSGLGSGMMFQKGRGTVVLDSSGPLEGTIAMWNASGGKIFLNAPVYLQPGVAGPCFSVCVSAVEAQLSCLDHCERVVFEADGQYPAADQEVRVTVLYDKQRGCLVANSLRAMTVLHPCPHSVLRPLLRQPQESDLFKRVHEETLRELMRSVHDANPRGAGVVVQAWLINNPGLREAFCKTESELCQADSHMPDKTWGYHGTPEQKPQGGAVQDW